MHFNILCSDPIFHKHTGKYISYEKSSVASECQGPYMMVKDTAFSLGSLISVVSRSWNAGRDTKKGLF